MSRRVVIRLVLVVVIVAIGRLGYAQQRRSNDEIQIETTLVEVDAVQLKVVRLRDNGDPSADADTAPFSLAVPESLAKSLARSPGAKILQNPTVQARLGKSTAIRVNTRVPSDEALPMTTGIDIDVQPDIGSTGDISISTSVRLWVNAGEPSETVFSTRTIRQTVGLTAGLTSIVGGIVTREEASTLIQMKMLKDVPMLSSFYSGRDGHRDREMIVMLTPRIPDTQKVAAPEPEVLVSKVEPAVKLDNPQVAPPRPVTAPPPIERPPVQPATPPVQSAAPPVPAAPPVEVKPYSVQVGAFSNQVTANNLKRELEKRYPDVFIEALVSTRVIYRVRVGHFKGIQAARQVEAQLKAEGLETTIAVNESK